MIALPFSVDYQWISLQQAFDIDWKILSKDFPQVKE